MRNRSILVVEDEYLLADDMRRTLEGEGALVLGPVPDVAAAMAVVEGGERIDAALLDINLLGERVFALADALIARGIPIAFATGYDRGALPERFAGITRLEKPVKAADVVATLTPLLL